MAGTLELREFPPGPAGLFPDPSGMRNRRGDPAFADGLRLAWKFAATASRSPRCVLWRLSLDGGVPDYAIDGGSLGAAFAVALRELLRVPRGSRSRFLAAPRAFFIGLRPRCAITGALATERPRPTGTRHRGLPGSHGSTRLATWMPNLMRPGPNGCGSSRRPPTARREAYGRRLGAYCPPSRPLCTPSPPRTDCHHRYSLPRRSRRLGRQRLRRAAACGQPGQPGGRVLCTARPGSRQPSRD